MAKFLLRDVDLMDTDP